MYKFFSIFWLFFFSSTLCANICFFSSHPNSAKHFSELYLALKKFNYSVEIFAQNSAKKVFQEKNIFYQEISDWSEEKLSSTNCAIVDVSEDFSETILSKMKKAKDDIIRILYYDNFASFVPGNYLTIAKKTAQNAQIVLFASSNISNPDQLLELTEQQTFALGFFPLEEIQQIKLLRESPKRKEKRKEFFKKHHLKDENQEIVLYIGGANSAYYTKGFPHFLDLLSNGSLQKYIFVFQQHPRAFYDENLDGKLLENWKRSHPDFQIVVSKIPSSEALIFADKSLYHQTTLSAFLAILNIPSMQISSEPMEDFFVENEIFSSSLVSSLEDFLEKTSESKNKNQALKIVGYKEDWKENLHKFFQEILVN